MRTLQDELLNQAFQLAAFIQHDRASALRITAAALENLETTTLTQDRRYYYLGQRTKVSFSELHLLQRLVYEKSEPFERAREADRTHPPSVERLLVHFIKHLVWCGVRRNSLYVTLGLSRLLHCYTTAETMELYNVITQDPAGVPGEDYFRNRKKVLMEELQERFAPWLTVTRGPRGARRFAVDAQPARFTALVNACLTAFTPWQTGCHVPESFSPTEQLLPVFHFNGTDPDAAHAVEIKRYHALLHPECLARLLHALGFATTAERLEIPLFTLTSQTATDDSGADDDDDDDSARGVGLTTGERDELQGYLRDRERQRKTASARILHFVANGTEVAQLDLERNTQVRFQLPRYAEFLEIRNAEDLLLATHRLSYDDDDQLRAQDAVIALQNGQQFAFTIAPPRAGVASSIEISYQETNWLRKLQTRWTAWWTAAAAPAPAFTVLASLAAVLLALTATFGLLWQRERQARQADHTAFAQNQTQREQLQVERDRLAALSDARAAELAAEQTKRREAESQAQALQTQLAQQVQQQSAEFPPGVPDFRINLSETRGSADAVRTITLDKRLLSFQLSFRLSDPQAFESYQAELRNASGQLMVPRRTVTAYQINGEPHFYLPLRRALFTAGQYQLRLIGQRGGTQTEIGQYSIKLQFE